MLNQTFTAKLQKTSKKGGWTYVFWHLPVRRQNPISIDSSASACRDVDIRWVDAFADKLRIHLARRVLSISPRFGT
jgi:hypothetical protein